MYSEPELPKSWNTKNILDYLYAVDIPIGDKFFICMLCDNAGIEKTPSKITDMNFLNELKQRVGLSETNLAQTAAEDLASRIKVERSTEKLILGHGLSTRGILTCCELLLTAHSSKPHSFVVRYVDLMEEMGVAIFG